jgi:hypothetical protein
MGEIASRLGVPLSEEAPVSHMVIFQTPDGNPGYNQFESLDEAVRFVEKLRNEQSVETARMFALEEVRFDFRPYFRVELDPPMVGPGSEPTATPEQEAPAAFTDPGFTTPADTSGAFGDPAPVGAAPPPPTFMAVPSNPPAEEPEQPTRRGLFGR